MIKYIKDCNGYFPLILGEGKIAEIDMDSVDNIRSLNKKEDQFICRYVVQMDMFYRHGYSQRLQRYFFGKGIVANQNKDIVAILCKDNKVVVKQEWTMYYPQDFSRLKKELKENGWNTRKDIEIMYSLSNFLFDPLIPSFADYSAEKQKEYSKEFLLSSKQPAAEEEDIFDFL